MHGRDFTVGQCGSSLAEQFYSKPGSKSCHEVITMPTETAIGSSCVTGKMAYYILLSILTVGVLVSECSATPLAKWQLVPHCSAITFGHS